MKFYVFNASHQKPYGKATFGNARPFLQLQVFVDIMNFSISNALFCFSIKCGKEGGEGRLLPLRSFRKMFYDLKMK